MTAPITDLLVNVSKVKKRKFPAWDTTILRKRWNTLILDYTHNQRWIKVKFPEYCRAGDFWKNTMNERVYLITRIVKDKLYCRIMKRKLYRYSVEYGMFDRLILLGTMEV